jgi:hypothetical protein
MAEKLKPAARPLTPAKLKAAIDKKALSYAGKNVSKKQVGLLAMLLSSIFSEDDERHAIQGYLFGDESLTDTEPEFILAALDWLKPMADSGGAYIPDTMAIQEAEAVLDMLTEDGLA